MTRKSRHMWCIALLTGMTCEAVRADIVNGGFEMPANPPAAGNYLDINPGQEAAMGFCGWTVESGNVDVVDGRAPLFGIDWSAQPSIDGDQILDLNGFENGTISQVFSNPPDQSFTLSFCYTNNPLSSPPETALVTVSDAQTGQVWLSQAISHNNATLTNPNWVHFAQTFVAVGTRTRIRFMSTTTPEGGASGGIVLDAVSIVGAGPVAVRGDMNCDGAVNAQDVTPFVEALLDPAAYAAAFVCCRIQNADINGDGTVDGLDIAPFTNCQFSGHCP